MLFNSSRWYYLDQLLPGDVVHNLAACPCLYSSSSTAKTTNTISGKSISCRAQLAWRICWRTIKKDDFSLPVEYCRAGNRNHTWKKWIQVKICCSSSVLSDLSKRQHLFKVFQSNLKPFEVIQSNFEIKLLPVQQASVWCLVLSYFYWKRDCWAPFFLPSFTALNSSPVHHVQPLPLSCAVVEWTKLLLPLTL